MAVAIDRPRRNSSLALPAAAALAAMAAAGAIDSQNAVQAQSARVAPWCAALGGWGGGFDCSYFTFEQCMVTARGLGNFCTPNPLLRYVEDRPRRRVRK